MRDCFRTWMVWVWLWVGLIFIHFDSIFIWIFCIIHDEELFFVDLFVLLYDESLNVWISSFTYLLIISNKKKRKRCYCKCTNWERKNSSICSTYPSDSFERSLWNLCSYIVTNKVFSFYIYISFNQKRI